MKIGVDYYPEQWDRELWEKDAVMMARTGVKLVRIGADAWQQLEPRDGEFNLSWVDEVIGMFSRHAIGTVLCTPIARPPAWLYQAYPEIRPTGGDEQSREVCINSSVYRGYAKRLTLTMIRHYSGNPAIAAWQTGVKASSVQCRCEACREKFRNWLIAEHNDLNGINKALGYSGSGGYSDISQIQPPEDRAGQDPSLSLEWHRFVSDCEADLIRELMLTIRLEDTRVPITADIASVSDAPDVYKLCDLLDFAGCDNYPPVRIPEDDEKSYSNAFRLDLMRGIKKSRFWVMEQLSGACCAGGVMTPAPEPGMIMGYSLQAMLRGADAVIHYRWRTALTGREMFRHGILDHNNVPGRRFHEFSELCRLVPQLDILNSADIISDAAILYSPESDAAFRIQPQTEGFSYMGQLEAFHSALTHFGANVDVVSPEADLLGYKLVIAPSLYINRRDVTENIYRYVINGGTVVLTLRSGVKDKYNNCIMDTLPTVFKELIGAEITGYDPIGGSQELIMRDFAGNEFQCSEWCDVIQPGTARAYAEYADGEYRGMPAVTMNRYSGGVAYYVGTVCEPDFCESFVSNLMMQTGIPRLKGLPRGVEVTTRTNGREEFICFFNNSDKDAVIPLPKPMFSVLGSVSRERLELRPFEIDIIRK